MTAIDPDALDAALTALSPLPTADGGAIVVLSTAGSPPAVAMLSNGDVFIEGQTVRAVLYGGASAARRLNGAFTLLVHTQIRAIRLEVSGAVSRVIGDLALIEGRLTGVRPTEESPWRIELRFFPDPLRARGASHLAYWRAVRAWLAGGAAGEPPPRP